ncbi:DNA-directed RNA polymerase subunit omega [Candidatus Bandiella euplotis]|uniref:DNA-directed RNA polymerase subunit omega n=1 Tax=Candidatus Bandiella euplotis TaxID=1664265 RepID=A0ABZ0UPH6_9RICK|nr:DNA-directed RNA polymerase subunit omega [Candidatus Bandiella woodruffii]WPX96899.1 DNA-directed RNA polymerase subunit omega [Candidatus Bandiella woodruffii]
MARITVEDCIKYVQNRFELVVVAAQRGKELNHGAVPVINDNPKIKKDKDAIIALREIAANQLNIESLKNSIIRKSSLDEDAEHVRATRTQVDEEEMDQAIVEEIESFKEPAHIQTDQLYQDEEISEE